MARIALQEYLTQINQLLDAERFMEAADHCRHILRQCPRHVETYRLHGKALLEQRQHADAADLFQRVLSSEPNDFISHVGLAIVHKEEGRIPEAIWHMERALEIEPYNTDVQSELKDLYQARDGQRPRRIPLPQAGLARLYFRGELYQQAITELHRLLAQEENRVDLETLLAETLWRNEQRVEAVDVCLKVLDQLPNCIQVNAILAEIWLLTGRIEEAQTYLQRLQDLIQLDASQYDTESAIGRAFTTEGAPPLPAEVKVTYLHNGQAAETRAPGESTPAWVEEALPGEETEGEDIYDWLQDVGPEQKDVSAAIEADPTETERDSDWFTDRLVASEEEAPAAGSSSGWLDDIESPESSESAAFDFEEDQIDEMMAPADSGEDEALFTDESSSSDSGESDAAAEEALQEQEGIPDWLAGDTADFEPLQVDADLAAGWLADEEEESPSTSEIDEAPSDDASDWLADLASDIPLSDKEEQQPVAPPPESAAESEGEDETLDWLLDMTAAAEPADAEETSDFDSLASEPLEPAAETAAGDDYPEWAADEEDAEQAVPFDDMEAFAEDSESAEIEIPDFSTDDLMGDEEILPDWLSDEDQPAQQEIDTGEERADSSESLYETPAPSTSDLMEEADELPEWLFDSDQVKQDEPSDTDEQIVEEAEPSRSSAPPDFSTSDFGAGEGDQFPDWLSDEMPDSHDEMEDVMSSDGKEKEQDQQDTPDEDLEAMAGDLEDAMEWLAEIADEEGSPLESLPAPEEDAETNAAQETAVESDKLPSPPDEETAAESGELPSWLGEETDAESDGMPDWLAAEAAQTELSPLDEIAFTEAEESEEMPDWLKDEPAESPPPEIPAMSTDEETAAEDVDLPDWLAAEETETPSPPAVEPDTAAQEGEELFDRPDEETTEPPSPTLEMPDDAAGEEEMPSADTDLPDWLTSELAEAAPPSQETAIPTGDLPDWLQPPEGIDEEPAPSAEATETDEELTDMLDWLQDPETAAESDAETAAEEEEDLSWMDEFVEGDLAAMDEAPTMEWEEEEEDVSQVWLDALATEETQEAIPEDQTGDDTGEADTVPETQKDAGTWLEEMASGEGAPLEEPPTMVGLPPESEMIPEEEEEPEEAAPAPEPDVEAQAETAVPEEEPQAAEMLPFDPDETPEDLDDAMAWLEELAGGDEAPVEELPSLFDSLETDPRMESAAGAETVEEPEPAPQEEEPEPDEAPDLAGLTDDLDDAMAWLEQLAAEQGTPLEELPAIPETLEAEPVAETEPEPTTETPEPAPSEEEPAISAADEPPGAPEDLDDAMAWLEQLAAEQGARLEELPSMAETPETETAAESETEPEPTTEAPEPAPSEEEAVTPIEPAGVPEDLDDAMAWLEQLAAGQGARLEELPSMAETPEAETAAESEPEPAAAPEPTPSEEEPVSPIEPAGTPEDLDDAMAWLEQLAAEQGAPLEELPTVAETPESEQPAEPDSAVPAQEPATDDTTDELEEALDWLEQLALQEGASLDEASLTEATVDDADDLEAALDWLEQLAQAEEEPVVEEIAPVEPETTPIIEDEEELFDSPDEAPEDPEAVLAWMEKLLDDELVAEAEAMGAPDETAEPPIPAESVEEEPTAEQTPPAEAQTAAEAPEDLDDAMAWLEQLAAGQGARLEELPTVTEAPEPPVAPTPEPEPSPAEPEPQPGPAAEMDDDIDFLAEMPEDPDEAVAWLEQMAASQDISMEELPVAPPDEQPPSPPEAETVAPTKPEPDLFPETDEPSSVLDDIFHLEGVDDSLPDWLPFGEDDADLPPQTDWLSSLPEPDVSGWLAAEEKKSTSELFESLPDSEPEPVFQIDALLDPDASPEPPAEDATISPTRAPSSSIFNVDRDQLSAAREAMAVGDYDTALHTYQSLVESGQGLGTLIADLETAANQDPQPLIQRLLGDAYMRNGQLQKALDAYRQALDRL